MTDVLPSIGLPATSGSWTDVHDSNEYPTSSDAAVSPQLAISTAIAACIVPSVSTEPFEPPTSSRSDNADRRARVKRRRAVVVKLIIGLFSLATGLGLTLAAFMRR